MKLKLRTLLAAAACCLPLLQATAQTATNPIVGTNTPLSVGAAAPSTAAVDNGITLYSNGGTATYSGATVSISSGGVGSDALAYTGTLPSGVTATYNSGTQVLTFSGSATAADYQALLRTVTISSYAAPAASKAVSFSIGSSTIVSYGGHYYEFVAGSISWTNAKAAAAARSLYGMTGYLATVTTAGENSFIVSKLGSDGWLGGSDDFNQINAATGTTTYNSQYGTNPAEGHWYWVTGPEAGTNFSNGNNSPVTVPGAYTNWQVAEPNDYNGGEYYLEIYSSINTWNDLPNTNVGGYVTEYGGIGSAAVLDFTRTINYACPAFSAAASVSTPYPLSGQELQTIYLGYGSTVQSEVITVAPTGGSGNYSYSWVKSGACGNTANLSNNAASYTFTPGSGDACTTNNDNVYTFSITVTDNANNCVASTSKKINVVNPFIGSNVQVCHKVAVRGGSSTQLLTVAPSTVATHLAHGDYLGNCTVFTGVKLVVPEIGEEENVAVYPNPSTGVFVLELSSIREGAQIMVTDVAGKLIATKSIARDEAPTATFDLSSLARGMYLIQVRDGELNYRTKIVMQ